MLLPLLIFPLAALLDQSAAVIQEAQTTPRVEISQSVGPPGGSVAVPIRLLGDERAPIGTLQVTLRFPTASLTFKNVEVGGLGESVGAKAATTSQRRGSETILEISLATPDKEDSREPLPDGPLAQVLFTVGKNLKPETVIKLAVEATAISASGPSRVALAAKNAEIIVSNPSIISCFFYMH